MGVRLKDLPPAVADRIRAALGRPAAAPSPRGPNKTEERYRAWLLAQRYDLEAVWFEALTFRLANGHRYTPDWIVVTADGRIEAHEVKGAYRLHSYQRARLAFDQAALEWPWIRWVWAELRDGAWRFNNRSSVLYCNVT